MSIEIINSSHLDDLFCTGSLTKLLTTYVTLSFLSQHYDLETILDDKHFLDSICSSPFQRDFLIQFQQYVQGQFTLRDIFTYYSGLPYTFDVTFSELAQVEQGHPFKHHAIPSEEQLLTLCKTAITPIYPHRSRFHYSEIGIIFLAYFLEKVFNVTLEELYKNYLIQPFQLKSSQFSRVKPDGVIIKDLSPQYDYPSIAILDHGYFCYSNGFYTTLRDFQSLISQLVTGDIFKIMVNIKQARAASNRLMNGLTVEIRKVGDDFIYGYEGLSFSGCNLWAYSTQKNKGYVIFHDSEEEVYKIVYEEKLGYREFDKVPEQSQVFYTNYLKQAPKIQTRKDVPILFQGQYRRVNINDSELFEFFYVDAASITIRNPELISYSLLYVNGRYHIEGKDHLPGSHVQFSQTASDLYFSMDGTLYKKVHSQLLPLKMV